MASFFFQTLQLQQSRAGKGIVFAGAIKGFAFHCETPNQPGILWKPLGYLLDM